jgi:hypothetical protein
MMIRFNFWFVKQRLKDISRGRFKWGWAQDFIIFIVKVIGWILMARFS